MNDHAFLFTFACTAVVVVVAGIAGDGINGGGVLLVFGDAMLGMVCPGMMREPDMLRERL